jgi:hypothetical protein
MHHIQQDSVELIWNTRVWLYHVGRRSLCIALLGKWALNSEYLKTKRDVVQLYPEYKSGYSPINSHGKIEVVTTNDTKPCTIYFLAGKHSRSEVIIAVKQSETLRAGSIGYQKR